jgi:Holliday junction resolvasome RuvABC DNA-binding subunit
VGVAVLGLLAGAAADTAADVQALTQTLDEQTGRITENSRVWVANEIADLGLKDALDEAGISVAEFTNAVLEGGPALEAMRDRIIDLRTNQELSTNATSKLLNATTALGDTASEAKDRWQILNEAQGENRTTSQNLSAEQRVLAESLGISADNAKDAASEISALDSEFNALLNSLFGVEEAEHAVAAAIDAVTQSAAENGATLDGNTDSGRKNAAAVRDLISDMTDLIVAEAEAGATTEELAELTADLEQEFIAAMRAAGYTEEQIEQYVKAFDDIPSIVSTVLELDRRVTGSFNPGGSGGQYLFQHGGLVSQGPSGIDQVPARLTRGEFVVREAATRQHLPLLQAINSGRPMSGAQFSGAGASLHVGHLEVKSVGVDFRSKQVMDDLAFHLALSGSV